MFGNMTSETESGIIPRALYFQKLFRQDIFSKSEEGSEITCSMLEIYRERLRDLFSC